LREKGLDILVANDVTQEGAGFDADTNVVTLFTRGGGEVNLPKLTKAEVADRVLDEVVRLRRSPK
jgi:phosphopantothenoylcysteine decarboxylase/phosphopantothenate--cysteine ligase